MSDNLLVFKAISNFVQELNESFASESSDNLSIRLYNRLLQKTKISDDGPIQKHVAVFKKWCLENMESILDKKCHDTPNISYSNIVYIDMKWLMAHYSEDSVVIESIHHHLLYILAHFDNSNRAKLQLMADQKQSGDQKGDTDFMSDFVSKVESHIDPTTSDPMEAIGKIMQSGVFTELVSELNSGISNGDIDMGTLMSSVQGMMGSLNNIPQ